MDESGRDSIAISGFVDNRAERKAVRLFIENSVLVIQSNRKKTLASASHVRLIKLFFDDSIVLENDFTHAIRNASASNFHL